MPANVAGTMTLALAGSISTANGWPVAGAVPTSARPAANSLSFWAWVMIGAPTCNTWKRLPIGEPVPLRTPIWVEVYRRPRVAVLSTGDELVEPDQEAPYGAIRDSNRPALLAAVREAGGEPLSLGIARDDAAEQRRLVERGLAEADVLVTSGGVSVGTRDLIKPLLEELGTVYFGQVALKPGKPLTFAKVGPKAVFGLPGNPVSSLVSFEVFVRPALRKMQGYARLHRPTVEATLDHEVRKTPDRTEYQRAIVVWRPEGLVARTTGSQSSSRLLSMVGANALLHIPPGEGMLAAGTRVPALLVGELVAE